MDEDGLESAPQIDFASRRISECRKDEPKCCSQHIVFSVTRLHCIHVQINFVTMMISFEEEIFYPICNSDPWPVLLVYSSLLLESVEARRIGHARPDLVHIAHCYHCLKQADNILSLRSKHC